MLLCEMDAVVEAIFIAPSVGLCMVPYIVILLLLVILILLPPQKISVSSSRGFTADPVLLAFSSL
jgi:hypothetical protein